MRLVGYNKDCCRSWEIFVRVRKGRLFGVSVVLFWYIGLGDGVWVRF